MKVQWSVVYDSPGHQKEIHQQWPSSFYNNGERHRSRIPLISGLYTFLPYTREKKVRIAKKSYIPTPTFFSMLGIAFVPLFMQRESWECEKKFLQSRQREDTYNFFPSDFGLHAFCGCAVVPIFYCRILLRRFYRRKTNKSAVRT